MYDADALEAINVEQLVTATDRLLLRGGQLSKRRHVRRFAEGSQSHIVVTRFAEASQPHIAVAPLEDASQPDIAVSGEDTRVDVPIAWETTVPHPVPPGSGPQPYLGTIVAAPFASAPHPALPVRDSWLDYVATAPRASEPAPDAMRSHPYLAFIAAAPFASDSYPAHHGRTSQPYLPYIAASFASDLEPGRGRSSQQLEGTAVIRRAAAPCMQVLALTVVIPALVGVAVGLAALL